MARNFLAGENPRKRIMGFCIAEQGLWRQPRPGTFAQKICSIEERSTVLSAYLLVFFFLILKNYLFIWLCQVLAVTLGSSLCHAQSSVAVH